MEDYPVKFDVDYSEKSDRLSVFFRLILVIPILIILMLLTSESYDGDPATHEDNRIYSVGIIFVPTLLMIVVRRKYPKWWFDWNLALTKFSLRVTAYLLLLRDEYPSTDEEQAVHLEIPYPDVDKELNQWMPLVKWFLVIPHFFLLLFVMIAVAFCTILAWFIIMFSGKYPRGIFNFIVGFLRWALRVDAYAILLTTDKYPPFSMGE